MKNGLLKRAAASVLSVSLLLGSGAYALFPETPLYQADTKLIKSTSLNSNVYWKESADDKVSENYLTYTPNSTVKPLVVYGSKVCNYGNFNDMAALLEKSGYNVIAGINGDYFNMDTTQPLGIVITEGKLRTSDDAHYAVGFKSDGTAIFGSPALNMSMKVDAVNYPLAGINKERTDTGFYLFTEDFSYTTKSEGGGTDVIFSIVSGALTVNSKVTLRVEKVSHSDGAVELPAGKMLLSVSDNAGGEALLKQLTVGKSVTVNVSCADTRWNSVQYAIGSLYKLVTKGKIEEGLDNYTSGPRSAVGQKANGELIFYTVDGRQPGVSVGATMNDVAERLLKMGCVEATLMDGGGSTTIGARYIGDSDYTLVNSPSAGAMRDVTNFIMLAAKGGGEAANMGIYPYDVLMLPKTQKTFTAGKSDNYGNPKSLGSVSWNVKSGGGSITDKGIFKSGEAGVSVITATSGGLSVSTNVNVVNPDSLAIYNDETGREADSLTLEAGQSVSLSAKALYKTIPIDADDSDFSWTLTGSAGTVDASGTLTAGLSFGSGTLTVRAGSVQKEIAVSVELGVTKLEDFEGSTVKLGGDSRNATFTLNSNMDYVRFGKKSANVKYDLTAGSAIIPASFDSVSARPYVSLWVYGDGKGSTLKLLSATGDSEAAVIDFIGWEQLILKTPGDVSSVQISGTGSGEIWLDHITAESAPVMDVKPPVISSPVINGSLFSAGVWDDVDFGENYFNMSVYCDGKALQYDYTDGQLQSYLPELDPGSAHRVTVYAADVSGNLSRLSLEIPAKDAAKDVFPDAKNHWAESYINYLYNMKILNGITENGVVSYRPSNNMTREQFAVVIARYMGLDLAKYTDTKLDFADAAKIQDYALPAVKAVSALGIIRGIADGDEINFAPADSLTRAQAMTIIGRITPAGYAPVEMNFTDVEAIPDWAASHIRALVSQGIISGNAEGQLLPASPVTRAEIAKIVTLLY